MAAEHRTEQAVLHPAHIELLELRIPGGRTAPPGVVGAAEEAADVGIEVGIACQREAQSGRHLLAQHVPRGVDVAAPHVAAVMLLTGIARTCHDEDTLAAVVLALRRIDAAHRLQREGVTLRTPGAAIHTVGIVALAGIEEVGVGRVHPPGIGAVVVEGLQVFPVDGTGLGVEGVVDLYTRRILHHRRPDVGDAALGPGLEGHQQSFLAELAELLGLWTEAGPDANHKMGVLLVHMVYHLLAIAEVF